jgi:hypothetical protein
MLHCGMRIHVTPLTPCGHTGCRPTGTAAAAQAQQPGSSGSAVLRQQHSACIPLAAALAYEVAAAALPGTATDHPAICCCTGSPQARGWVSGVLTQNVDRLHHRAGSNNVLELHGTTHRCATAS